MNNDQVSTAAFLVVGAAICLQALSYNLGRLSSPGSGFMPFVAGAAMVVCAGIGFVNATVRRRAGARWSSLTDHGRWSGAVLVIVALGVYALLLVPLGFVVATFLFMASMFRVVVPLRWPVVLGGALAASLLSYVVFGLWLKAPLPRGPWGW